MPIRYRLDPSGAASVAFVLSPLVEAMLSLHVLIEPSHHALQQGWVRRARAFSPALRRDIEAFSFLYRGSFYPALTLPAPGTRPSFEAELQRLARVPSTTVQVAFTRALHGTFSFQAEPNRVIRAAIEAGSRGTGRRRNLLLMCFDQPERLITQLVDFLRSYWRAGFALEWRRLEPRLLGAIDEATGRLDRDGPYSTLEQLWPEVRLDRALGEVWLDRPVDMRIALSNDSPLLLQPSAFVWPHVRAAWEWPARGGLVYPAPFVVKGTRRRVVPRKLVDVLKCLGDEDRLRIMRLAAERRRSTQELARLLVVSESTASRHVHLLTRARLLEGRREGRYVLYGVRASRLASLPSELQNFLDPSRPHVNGRD